MRGFVGFLIAGGLLALPALAQRVGNDFDGRGFVTRGGFVHEYNRVYSGDSFTGHRYVGFSGVGVPAGWPVDVENSDYSVPVAYDRYSDEGSALCRGCTYGDLSAYPAEQSPPRVTVYNGSDQTCPQVHGKALYRIAIPPDRPDRRGKMSSTYQNNLRVAHDYWYTDGRVNFVTMQGERISTPISSIDRALTLQLNRECGVNFEFPTSAIRTH